MFRFTDPITTSRLVLRPFEQRDEADMLAFESREDVAQYLYNEPRTPEDNARELATRVAQTTWENDGDTLILAVDYAGTVVGYVLLSLVSRSNSQGEFGFVLHPDYQGRGIASEASVEVLRLGFETLNLHRIIGRCDPRNEASARLMEKLGLRKEAHFRELEIFKGEWGDELTYAMLSSEWENSQHSS